MRVGITDWLSQRNERYKKKEEVNDTREKSWISLFAFFVKVC